MTGHSPEPGVSATPPSAMDRLLVAQIHREIVAVQRLVGDANQRLATLSAAFDRIAAAPLARSDARP